jgi:hypothetical protein
MTLGKLLDETTIKFSLAAHAEFIALQQRGVPPVDALQIAVCASLGAAISITFTNSETGQPIKPH